MKMAMSCEKETMSRKFLYPRIENAIQRLHSILKRVGKLKVTERKLQE